MPHKPAKKMKRASIAERPFPWRCRHCGKQEVFLQTMEYEAEIRHDGRLHSFTIPALELPVCQACGEKVFTEKVDAQENEAFRTHLKLLSPAQIRDGIKRIGMSQRDAAARLGVAEATLSRWLNETQIQSRAMDNLLRAFFAFPQLRSALCGESQDPEFGLSSVSGDHANAGLKRVEYDRSAASGDSWMNDWNGRKAACREVLELVQTTGSTWGRTEVA
ncbi:MAG: type II TA system antitoxin MqsA family protein [Planctomycetota bacterium]